jgi:diguanylate cyclase (GGDEF)-like protein
MLHRLRQFADSFVGRLLISLAAIQLVLVPLALWGIYRIAETELHDRFVDFARRDTAQFARMIELGKDASTVAAMLDDLVLSGALCSAKLVFPGGRSVGPESTCAAPFFIEDFEYGGHGDQTYFVQARTGPANHLQLGFDEAPVNARMAEIGFSLIYAGLLWMMIAMSLVVLAGQRLGRSLKRLSAAARLVAQGDSSSSLLVSTPISEVASLSRDLEAMRVTLVERATELRDINSQLVAARDEARHAAYFDALTGLPNRTLFGLRAQALIAQAKRLGSGLSFLFVDLDRFKHVNDSLGHAVGDELLKALSVRLRATLRETDLISRLGGDEFAVVVPNLANADDAIQIARKLLLVIEQPVLLLERELQVSASIGISTFPQDGQELHVLLKQADMAMYQAKEAGRNNVRLFSANMARQADKRLRIEGELRTALRDREFILHYQPQYRVDDFPELIGAEALIRWQHPRQGLLSPAHFIAAAEDMDLIVPLGQWVLEETCRQLAAWRDEGCPISHVAVNVSVTQLKQEGFSRKLQALLDGYRLPPDALEVEVTESVMLEPDAHIFENLRVLKEIGVHIALDDFGTGFSGLASLTRLPVHKIKIDQSFVQELGGNATGKAIVLTTLALARNLSLGVIAEGVETEEQRDRLIELGCRHMQGYLFSRPVPPEILAGMVSSQQLASTVYGGLL